MGFPEGWLKKAKISAVAAKTTGEHVDFPLLLTEDCLPSEIFTSAIDGGGDIRFSSDVDGVNQLACEIVYFISGDNKTIIWVKVPVWDSAAELYIWWNKAGATQPLPSSAYGSQSVWNKAKLICHMNLNNLRNSANNTVLSHNNVVSGQGKWGEAAYFNSASVDCKAPVLPVGDFTQIAWVKPKTTIGYDGIVGDWVSGAVGRSYLGLKGGKINWDGYATSTNFAPKSIMVNEWSMLCVTRTGSSVSIFHNGILALSLIDSGTPSRNKNTYIGALTAGKNHHFHGIISEIQLIEEYSSPNRILTKYNNQNDPAGFVEVGAVEDLSFVKKMAGKKIILPFYVAKKALILTQNISGRRLSQACIVEKKAYSITYSIQAAAVSLAPLIEKKSLSLLWTIKGKALSQRFLIKKPKIQLSSAIIGKKISLTPQISPADFKIFQTIKHRPVFLTALVFKKKLLAKQELILMAAQRFKIIPLLPRMKINPAAIKIPTLKKNSDYNLLNSGGAEFYITKEGDNFDLIAHLYPNDIFALLIEKNSHLAKTASFSAGIKIIIPKTDQIKKAKQINLWD